MGKLWQKEEVEILIQGKKDEKTAHEISELLHEKFGDTYRKYTDNVIKLKWQFDMKKDPSLKKLATRRGNWRRVSREKTFWSTEEKEALKAFYLDGAPYVEIVELMNKKFPNVRQYSVNSLKEQVRKAGLANRKSHEQKKIISEENWKEELQNKTHPRLKILSAINSLNIEVECLDCKTISWKTHSGLMHACNYCEGDPNSPKDIYLIHFSDFLDPSIKIGISNDFFDMRSKSFPTHEVLLVISTTTKKAILCENMIKEKYDTYRTNPYELESNGSTECFDPSVREQIIKDIKEYFHESSSN